MTYIHTGPHSGKNHIGVRQPRRGCNAAARLCATLLCLIFLAALPGALRAAPTEALLSPPPVSIQKLMVPPALSTPSAPLLPRLQYFIDQTGTMDVEEVATPANASAFQLLNMKTLPRTVGIMWLRFTLAPLPQGAKAGTMLLDMGASVPEGLVLYEPHVNPLTENVEWREIVPTQRDVLLLPEATSEPLTCYIRLDGAPGLWFEPMLRTPQDAANNWGSLAGTAAILAMGVVMLLCLLRGLSEKGQWRIWTALYVAAALAQAIMGMPGYGSGHITMLEAAAVLSPGVALMLLPHVGRHLLRTKQRSRLLDAQFVLLSLPGAALALLPLMPGFSWIIRYLALWPVCTLIFVPSAIGGAVMGLGGAKRFLLGCLLPPAFVTAGILGVDSGYAANLMASAPLWGTVLSALIIAGTGAPRDMAQNSADGKKQTSKKKGKSLPGLEGFGDPGMPDVVARGLGDADTALMMEDGAINLDQPLDDPNLRLLPPSPAASGGNAWKRSAEAPLGTPAQSTLSWGGGDSPEAAPAQTNAANRNAQSAFAGADPCLWENALRAPLDRLMREGAALSNCSLPPAVRQYAENMLEAATDLAHAVDNPGKSLDHSAIGEPRSSFNLQHMVREAHDAVSTTAENAGIGLAWYMPPLLGHMYEGQAQTLRETLCLLLESAVRATTRGAVHLSVRRVPESADPGHLLFTVTDTGAGIPPRSRSTLALTRAWELAGTNNCYLNVECGPHGTTISFTLRLKPLEQETAAPEPREAHVTIVADRAVERQDLAHMTAAQGLQSTEARTMREALELNKEAPALLLVVHSPMDGPAETDALDRFRNQALDAGLPFFKALAITADDSRWDALAESGYTHALLEPVERSAFAVTLREVFEEAGFSLPDPKLQDVQQSPEGTDDQASTDAAATAEPADGHSHPEESQSSVPGAAEASLSDLPDLFGASSPWTPHDADSMRLPDLTALPQILGMTDQMRETTLPWPESSAPATSGSADPAMDPHEDAAAHLDLTEAAMVADAGVLLPHMAPLPEQPEDPNDPDIPDLSNLESLQLPLPGTLKDSAVGEITESSEELTADLSFESLEDSETSTATENADASDSADIFDSIDATDSPDSTDSDDSNEVAASDGLGDDDGQQLVAGDTTDETLQAHAPLAEPVEDLAAEAAPEQTEQPQPEQAQDAFGTVLPEAEPVVTPDGTLDADTTHGTAAPGDSGQNVTEHDVSDASVDAADFIAAAGLEGPQWDTENISTPEPAVDASAHEDALSGPEQAMSHEDAAQQPSDIPSSDVLSEASTPAEDQDPLDQPAPMQTAPALSEASQPEQIQPESAPTHGDGEEAATEDVVAVEGEYQNESSDAAAMPAEAQPEEFSTAEADAVSVQSANDGTSEQTALQEPSSGVDAAPESRADEAGAPAASLAAAISNSTAHAGQPVITIQGKIGEAVLRPVNAPAAFFAPSTPQADAPSAGEGIKAEQDQAQPEVRAAGTADASKAASPEEYLDRKLPGSSAALHDSLSWGDEWVGEPMPIGTPPSAGARTASASAPATAAVSQAVKAAPESRAYVSPSLSGSGEWVGEPTPMTKSVSTESAERPAQARSLTTQKTQNPSLPGADATTSDTPAKPLRAIPWPGPNLSETEGKGAVAPAAVASQEPVATAQKTRELPRTATGRLILKLLGNVAASESAPELAAPSSAPVPAEPEKSSAASRTAATRQGADSEPSFVDFIAGATPPPAGQDAAPHIPAEQPPVRRQEEVQEPPVPQAAATPPMAAPPVQEDKALIQLVQRLDVAMEDAQQAYKGRSCHGVGEAAGRIANDSDAFGFRVLARMARCVERAAKANDMNALRDLLPELSVAVERNRIALNPRHQGR
ncbi:MAG: 7TM-DISM domain-containing protein [Desulfovibrio sp.]|uniref:7TM-DISM domain-containing protein n=1 Tax=Desulfovibrio sp. TaxID=885 RepID=UPI0039E23C7E